MKLPKFEYASPTTVEEAVMLLTAQNGTAKVLAGGQSTAAGSERAGRFWPHPERQLSAICKPKLTSGDGVVCQLVSTEAEFTVDHRAAWKLVLPIDQGSASLSLAAASPGPLAGRSDVNQGAIIMRKSGFLWRRLLAIALFAILLLGPGTHRAALAQGGGAWPGPTINTIKKRGMLVCGVDTGVPGFASQDSAGKWRGLDISYCRAIAAALLNDAEKVRYVPTTAAARFTILQSGEIDVLIRDSTLTFTRNIQLGLDEIAVNFYAGEGFLVSKKLGLSKVSELNGATICLVTGATLELNIADYARSHGVKIGTLLFDKSDEAVAAMQTGRCDGYTDDVGSLAGVQSTLKTPDEWVVLEGLISKEPMGIHARTGDAMWSKFLFWLDGALKSAEEFGVTKATVDEKRSSTDPFIRRLLGVEGGFGNLMGVDDDWAARAIKAVGNYGEIYDEYFGSRGLKLPRGLNNLWTNGGLYFPLPFR